MKKLVMVLVISLLCIVALSGTAGAASEPTYDTQLSSIEMPPPPIICAPIKAELASIELPPGPIICVSGREKLASIEMPPPPIICVIGKGELA